MDELATRPMTAAEFVEFRANLIRDYGADHVAAGNWAADQADELAARQLDGYLPDGPQTAGMLVMVGETADGQPVGHFWVALQHADSGGGAWILDIEVAPGHRGKGYGRALLAATERETLRHGVQTIGLNVFGTNTVARRLYESAGYDTTTLQMRKKLSG
jgi:GNAT superfamily N-acetyltransferase